MKSIALSICLSVCLSFAAAFAESNVESYFGETSELLAQNTQTGGTTPVASAEGFADTPWKTAYNDVKARLKSLAATQEGPDKVEILSEEKNVFILVRRNDILYRYSFYRTPVNVVKLTNHKITEQELEDRDAVLFHVKIQLPFIDAALVKAKMETANGNSTKSTVDKTMSGAQIWELGGSLIIQWYEPYKRKAYTRTLDYLSREVAATIMKEYADYFDAREKALLRDLIAK